MIKTKKIKFLFLLLFITVVFSVFADKKELSLHLECKKSTEECIRIHFFNEAGKTILIKKDNEMVLTKDNISKVTISKNQFDIEQLSLVLKKKASKNFEQITGKNIRKRIAIVYNDKALIAPVVNEQISDGRILVESSFGSKNNFSAIPLFKDLLKNNDDHKQNYFYLYLLLGAILIIGSLSFVFF